MSNAGPSRAQSVALTDQLPAQVTVRDVQPSQGTCSRNDRTVECAVGTLEPDATASVAVKVVPDEEGELSNRVVVRGNVSDREGANDAATETTEVLAAPGGETSTQPGTSSEPSPGGSEDQGRDPDPPSEPSPGGSKDQGRDPCVSAASRVRPKRIGRAGLGNRRSTVRRTFGSEGRYRRFLDRYCLSDGTTIRVGYPSFKSLRALVRRERRRLRGKASLVLTSSRQSTLRGINVGDSVAALLRRTGRRRGVRVGRNVWYVRRGARAGHVFRVQDGVVREVGLADRKQTATNRRVKRFFTSER